MMETVRRIHWISQLLTLAVIAATGLPLCGAMFRCGCSVTGGSSHCNMHHADGSPHCPWCAAFGLAPALTFLAVLPVVGACVHVAERRGRSIPLAVGVGLAAYAPLVTTAGWVTAKAMGYPTWFGWPV